MSGNNPNFTRGLVANLTVATGAKAKNILIFLASCGKVEKATKAVNNIRTINKPHWHKLDKNFTWQKFYKKSMIKCAKAFLD